MTRLYKFLSAVIMMALTISGLYAQGVQTDINRAYSPNAADLGRYGQVPVNYFNGLASVKVPLTEVKGKGITVPVYLSYHAGGNRTDEHPGWVGLGWSLHAGGCINRIVNGMKDEMSALEAQESGISNSGTDPGNLYHASLTQTRDWGSEQILSQLDTDHNFMDYEPDEFQVCLEGISASFYIVGDNEVKIVSRSDDDFKVEWVLANENSSSSHALYPAVTGVSMEAPSTRYTYFYSITLINSDGVRYTFGNDENAIESSTIMYGGEMRSSANTWYLKTIETPYGETVTFSYEKDGIPIIKNDARYKWSYTDMTTGAEQHGDDSEDFLAPDVRRSLSFALLQPSYLISVTCRRSGDSVTFAREETTEARYSFTENEFVRRFWGQSGRYGITFERQRDLDHYCQLSVLQHGDLRISFNYTSSESSRLKLLKVAFNDIQSSDEKIMEYSMEYNNDVAFPGYHAKRNDIWGFYNGISHAQTSFLNLEAVRVPDADKMKLDILTRITYPTGGYTIFEYEPHTYSKIMRQNPFHVQEDLPSGDNMAGGLRIRSITDVPLVGESVVRTFSYMGNDGNSSGILSGLPEYNSNGYANCQLQYEVSDRFWDWHVYDMTHAGTFMNQQENYINQLSTTNGNHVTYSMVTESISGNGMTVYTYTNHDDARMMDQAPALTLDNFQGSVLSSPFNSRALFRGLLKSKTIYSEDGHLMMSGQYEYNIDTTRIIRSAAMSTSCGGWVKRLSFVEIPCCYPSLSSCTEATYPQGGGVPSVVNTTYTYDASHRQMLSRTRTSEGDSSMTESVTYTYPNNISLSWNDTYSGMVARYMLSEPIQTTLKRNGKVRSSTLTTWKENESSDAVQYVPDKTYEAATDADVTGISTYYGTSGSFSDRFTSGKVTSHDRYDSHGNPTTITGSDGVQTSMVWEKGRDNPSAVFRNAGTVETSVTETYDATRNSSFILYSGSANSFSTTFSCVSSEPVTLSIYPFDTSADWYVNISVDNRYSLSAASVSSMSSSLSAYYGTPSSCSVTIPSGSHSLRLETVLCSQSTSVAMCGVTLVCPYAAARTATAEKDSFLFEGFEDDDDALTGGFHSGRAHSGNYTVRLDIDPDRNYSIDYMVYSGGRWNYTKHTFTGSFTISESGPIDNVRVYPDDSEVTSYTWDGHGNMLSATDTRGITTSYAYDAMDRLLSVRDNAGNAISSYEYSHATSGDPISISGNSVRQEQYTAAGDSTSRESIAYYDGLGRKVQTVLRKASPYSSDSDIIDWTEYDPAGRVSRVWQPTYKPSNGGNLAERPANAARWPAMYTSAETRPFAETIYEPSPLERVSEVYGPGKAWHDGGKSVRTEILNNLSGGNELVCRRYTASAGTSSSPALTVASSGNYPAGTLSVTRTTDEDGRTTLEFTDMYGQRILTRAMDTGDSGTVTCLDTYYVYDAIGRLAAVLPPALSSALDSDGSWTESTSSVADYAYLYRYDDRGNVIARKLPGCGWDHYIYDRGGRLVMSQDPVQRGSGVWSFNLQDKLGREVLSGLSTGTISYLEEPYRDSCVYAALPKAPSYDGQFRGYAVSGISLPSAAVLSASYYDGYGFLGHNGIPSATSASVSFDLAAGDSYAAMYTPSSSGMLTGTLEAVLGTSGAAQHLWHVYYYDDRGQVAQARFSSHTGGVEKYWYGYDFTGNVLNRRHSYEPSSGQPVTETYAYTYDSWGRPLQTTLAVGNAAAVTVTGNSYDNIGRLGATGRSGNTALTTAYGYNIRTWMTSMQGSLFNETLHYQDGAIPQWGGNISSMEWKTGNESATRRYNYAYDGLSRLVSADYAEPSVSGAFSETYAYDMNGNMTGLSRYGLNASGTARAGLLDLTLTNTGNRLTSIGTSAVGYDSKGRQTSYSHGGASTMSYNAIDLPLLYTKGTTSVEWKYSAGGVKLQKRTTSQ